MDSTQIGKSDHVGQAWRERGEEGKMDSTDVQVCVFSLSAVYFFMCYGALCAMKKQVKVISCIDAVLA